MSEDQTKVCSKCGEEKSFDSYRAKRNVCKECERKGCREWKASNKERISEYNKEYGAKYYEENKTSVLEKQKKYYKKNSEKIYEKWKLYYANNSETYIRRSRKYYSENKEHVTQTKKSYRNRGAIYSKRAEYLKFAEPSIMEGADGELLVECTYCAKYYQPTNSECSNRQSALSGNQKYNRENRFYCSDACKQSCPIFGQSKYSKTEKELLKKNGLLGTSREVPAEFRKMALADRDWTCEKCGAQSDLHVHHIDGYSEAPMFAADLGNVLVVCQSCHIEIHKQPGCSYYDYSRCKPEVQIPAQQEDQKLASTGTE